MRGRKPERFYRRNIAANPDVTEKRLIGVMNTKKSGSIEAAST